MSKLVDRERLARLAAALDARMKAAVQAEEQRAKGVEEGLQNAINAINDAENGILKQAQNYVDGKVEEINDAAEALDGRVQAVEEAIAEGGELEARVAANEEDIERLDGAVDVEGSVKKQIKDAVDPVQAEVDALEEFVGARAEGENPATGMFVDIAANAAAAQAAQNAADQAQQEVDAVEERVQAIEESIGDGGNLEARVAANEELLEKLDGAVDVEGSVKKQIKDAVDPVQAEVDALEEEAAKIREDFAAADVKVLEDANKYADEAITALVNGAPEAMNTLQELAKAISDHKDVYEAYVNTLNEQINTKVEKVDGARLITEEEAAAFAAKAEVADVEAAQQAAEAKAAQLDAVIQGEVDALEEFVGVKANGENPATGLCADIAANAAAAQNAQQEVDAVEERVQALEDAIGEGGELEARVAANEEQLAKLDGAVDVEGSVKKQIKDAVDPVQAEVDAVEERVQALEDADEAMQGEVDALEEFVGAKAEGENPATGLCADIAANAAAAQAAQNAADQAQEEVDAVEERVQALEDAIGEGGELEARVAANEEAIQNNADAIAKLNGGAEEEGSVAKAIADALEPFSTTEEVKAILGNVVNSLSLVIEDNKLKLTLGGVEGITLAEQELDMATDDDIDAIIAGLDNPAE